MTIRTAQTAPFPRLADDLRDLAGGEDLQLRSFGSTLSDLEIDFGELRPPLVITELLQACTCCSDGKRVPPDFFWSLPVGKRLECLLALVALGGTEDLTIASRCPSPACGKRSEVYFTSDELLQIADRMPLDDRVFLEVGGRNFTVRRATGKDQLEWLRQSFADDEEAQRGMASTLTGESLEAATSELLRALYAAIESAMEEHDPLVGFTVAVACAECGLPSNHAIDFAEVLLQLLLQRQRQLIRTVHQLATAYHWSEAAIVAIPEYRRQLYLKLIKEQSA